MFIELLKDIRQMALTEQRFQTGKIKKR